MRVVEAEEMEFVELRRMRFGVSNDWEGGSSGRRSHRRRTTEKSHDGFHRRSFKKHCLDSLCSVQITSHDLNLHNGTWIDSRLLQYCIALLKNCALNISGCGI